MKTLELLNLGSNKLKLKRILSHQLDSELILSRVLKKSREKIIIDLNADTVSIRHGGLLFMYFSEKRNLLLDNSNNCIECIEMHWEFNYNSDIYAFPSDIPIFGYSMNKEYSVDKDIIEVDQCDLKVETLGIIYQNLVHWLQAKCQINVKREFLIF